MTRNCTSDPTAGCESSTLIAKINDCCDETNENLSDILAKLTEINTNLTNCCTTINNNLATISNLLTTINSNL